MKSLVDTKDTAGVCILHRGRNILLLEQTIRFKFDPWQGLNVTVAGNVQNDRWFINANDKDKRPSLGLWFYDLKTIMRWKMGLLAQHPIIKGPPYGPEGAPRP